MNRFWAFQLILLVMVTGSCNFKVDLPPENPIAGTKILPPIPDDTFAMQLGTATRAPQNPALANQGIDYCFNSIEIDDEGNIYCAGSTTGDVAESNGGSYDVIMMKFDNKGTILWAKQFGASTKIPSAPDPVATANSGSNACRSIALDKDKNVYCFGVTAGNFIETTGGGGGDFFVIKLDKDGNFVWATQFGANTKVPGAHALANQGNEKSTADLVIDSKGDLFFVGQTTGAFTEANAGSDDIVLVKMSANGQALWAKQFGASTKVPGAPASANQGLDKANSIALDKNDNIYITGITGGAFAETSGGGNDIIVMKLEPDGDLVWAKQLGASTKFASAPGTANQGSDNANGIVVDSSSNIYLAGNTSGALVEANGGGADIFVMKLKTNGDLDWGIQYGQSTKLTGGDTSNNDYGYSLTIDNNANLFVVGITSGNLIETQGGNGDAYILKLSKSGGFVWAKQFGSVTVPPGSLPTPHSALENTAAFAIDRSGNLYVGGQTLGSIMENNAGNRDDYLMKLKSTGEF